MPLSQLQRARTQQPAVDLWQRQREREGQQHQQQQQWPATASGVAVGMHQQQRQPWPAVSPWLRLYLARMLQLTAAATQSLSPPRLVASQREGATSDRRVWVHLGRRASFVVMYITCGGVSSASMSCIDPSLRLSLCEW